MKSKTKKWLGAIAIVLVSVTLCGVLGSAFGLFTKDLSEVTLREHNEANLLSYHERFEDYNEGDGITATLKKDGRISLKGENKLTGDIVIPLEDVTLSAGTYSIWGAPNGGNKSYHIAVTYTDADGATQTSISDFKNNTITLTSQQTVSVKLVVCPDTTVYATIAPVLCEGTENVGFFA